MSITFTVPLRRWIESNICIGLTIVVARCVYSVVYFDLLDNGVATTMKHTFRCHSKLLCWPIIIIIIIFHMPSQPVLPIYRLEYWNFRLELATYIIHMTRNRPRLCFRDLFVFFGSFVERIMLFLQRNGKFRTSEIYWFVQIILLFEKLCTLTIGIQNSILLALQVFTLVSGAYKCLKKIYKYCADAAACGELLHNNVAAAV